MPTSSINMCGPADNHVNMLYCIWRAFFLTCSSRAERDFLTLLPVVNVNESTVNSNNVKGSHTNNNVKESRITLVNVKLKS